MRPRDLFDLILLAALWGGSFLFMRVASPEFGPVALIALRVGVGALFLCGVLALTGRIGILRGMSWPIAIIGLINSAIPFVLFAFATLTLTAGFTSILNATAPLWTAVVALAWFDTRLAPWAIIGLALGFGGVVILSGGGEVASGSDMLLAVAAALTATFFYGITANYAKIRLAGVDPMLVATGSQLASTIAIAPFAFALWPATAPSAEAWGHAIVLGVASTGIAYILYFRLIANLGPTRAVTVTFLIPVFGVLWGVLFLGEAVSLRMLVGAAIVLAGTAISTGVLPPPRRFRSS